MENKQVSAEEKARLLAEEEDEYFEGMLKAFQANPNKPDIDDDIQYFTNHPLNCREITPEMLQRPEFQALQSLAYDGTPEEVCTNFKNQAMESLTALLIKDTKNAQHDKVECERAMHFFNEAFETGCKKKELLFELYQGRAKLNLLIAQFGKCKEDCLEALKINKNDEILWLVLSRSRYFVEKWQDGLKYANQGLEHYPNSTKLENMKNLFQKALEREKINIENIQPLKTLAEDKKIKVYRNLREKKVKLGKKLHHLPETVEQQIYLDDEEKLHFPVLLLYDEFMATDYIQDWREDVTLKDELWALFESPPPFDQNEDYTMKTIEVYFEADQTEPLDIKDSPKEKSKKKYIKLDLNQSLLSVLQHQNHIVPQYPVLKIISNESDFKDSFLNEI